MTRLYILDVRKGSEQEDFLLDLAVTVSNVESEATF